MKIYLYGSIVFYPFVNHNWRNNKWVKGHISGELTLDDIFTEQEILERYPKAEAFKNLKELMASYES